MKRTLLLLTGACQQKEPEPAQKINKPKKEAEKPVIPVPEKVTVANAIPGWAAINLNVDYTIQFPDSLYTGRGYQLQSAGYQVDQPTLIVRKDDQVRMSGTFCDPTAYPCWVMQYGDALQTPLPDSISFGISYNQIGYLTSRFVLNKDSKPIAVFYYGVHPGSVRTHTGRLYTFARESNKLRYTGSASFNAAAKQEVLDVLSTIAPR